MMHDDDARWILAVLIAERGSMGKSIAAKALDAIAGGAPAGMTLLQDAAGDVTFWQIGPKVDRACVSINRAFVKMAQ